MTQQITQEAKKAYDKKDYQHAAEGYAKAAALSLQTGDELQAAEMQNNASVAWLQAGKAQLALDAALGSDMVFYNAGDRQRQALALGNQAAALEELGRFIEALDKYQQSADLLKELGENDMRTYVLQRLAGVQLRTGDQFQSLASMHIALENKKKLSLKERFLQKLLRIPFRMPRK